MLRSDFIHAIKKDSDSRIFPDGTAYTGISVRTVEKLAEDFKTTGRHVEVSALEHQILPDRYARNMKTFSLQDQLLLLKSQVTIAGLGGLGGLAAEILAREGVGRLNLIDGDKFEDTNLNRQLLCTNELLSVSKVQAAINRIVKINPSIDIDSFDEFLNQDNAEHMIDGSDVVLDCLDNIKTRFILEKAAKKNGIPLVSAAIAGNTGHLTTIFPEDPGLSSVYGILADNKQKGAEDFLGCLSHTACCMASLECSEVIKILLKNGRLLQNQLLIADMAENIFEIIDI
ncbi:THIF-type NAD/FAD binding fold-containing protein [Desulfonema limicola]|uniref:THIF-type NAD/FAD binding fold-containing protein n=1 Tax=Desulfonema limicola TaxID=45656 RepID=A0A975GFY0_9BACT|nr:HesA/MoeB/ThiF family protein [Desulfonema limicola]QTA79737.1 THIF-type NAD/FAD binding fold-containing protein [Desulfonema limicola]